MVTLHFPWYSVVPSMLSDELQSKPELLVEFVQNASIPLGNGLVGVETKDLTCLSLLPETSECASLLLPDSPREDRVSPKAPETELLTSLQLDPSTDSRDKSETALLSPSEPSSLLQDLPTNDNSSFIFLNLSRSGLGSPSDHMVFVQDEAEDSRNDFLHNDCTDSSTPWFLRVQELAHDSLIAATRAQLAKHAKSISSADATLNSSCEAKAALPEKKLFHCSFHGCGRSFVRPTHLRYHLKTHKNERSYTCTAEGCGKSFYVLQSLKVHMRTHNGERPFLCTEPGCEKQFTTAGNLKNHLRVHTGEKPFLCEEEGCGRSFAEYSSLRKHLVVHSGVKSHQCPVCCKNFSQSGSRNAHVRKHHSVKGADATMEDQVAHKAPDTVLLNSLQLEPSTDSRDHKSETTLLSPSEPSSLLQDLPTNDNSFIFLNLARSGLGSPSEHMVFVQDEAEDSGNDFLHNDCTDSSTPWFLRVQELAHDSLIAATRAQLAKHAKSISSADATMNSSCESRAALPEKKLFHCSFHGCDRSFVHPTHLRYHLKTHINERSYTCTAEGCGKSFYVLQSLKVHMRTHNGERPFLCTEPGCEKQFTTAGNLKNHLRVHTGEKPFLCEEEGCGRSFAEYSSLRKHLVVHSGVKSHQCPVCCKNFSQSGSRNAHVRKHHSVKGTDHSTASQSLHLSEESLTGSHLLSIAPVRHSYEDEVSSLLN